MTLTPMVHTKEKKVSNKRYRIILAILGAFIVTTSAQQIWGNWAYGLFFGIILIGYSTTIED
jgi:hypothetical protein